MWLKTAIPNGGDLQLYGQIVDAFLEQPEATRQRKVALHAMEGSVSPAVIDSNDLLRIIKELRRQDGVTIAFSEPDNLTIRQDTRLSLYGVERLRGLIHHGRTSGPTSIVLAHAYLMGVDFCSMCGSTEQGKTLLNAYQKLHSFPDHMEQGAIGLTFN